MGDNNRYYYKQNEICIDKDINPLSYSVNGIIVDSNKCEFCYNFNGHGVDDVGKYIYCNKLFDK